MFHAIHGAMTLESIVESIRTFPGITRKNAIKKIVKSFPVDSFPQVAASEGEDAAAIDNGDNYTLFATDGIMESLVESDPFYAGYFAVLVNVNDIAAMGGKALAMVDVISQNDSKSSTQILKGMDRAIRKFNVPIVGGHTHPDCKYNAVDISIIGTVPKDDIILSSTATPGDDVVFVMDLDGFFPKNLKYAYDTTTNKEDSLVRAQMDAMVTIASEHLVHSGKDMSNPGSIGTLGMMLECSGVGATVRIEDIPIPHGVDLFQWLLTYQGCGFVFSCPPENSQRIIEIFSGVGCAGAVVGSVNGSNQLKVEMEGKNAVVFDFKKDIITGCKPKKK